MPVCVSPNGSTTSKGATPATEVFVATAEGIEVLRRDGLGAPWQRAGRRLDGIHVGAIYVEPVRGGLFAAGHYEGGLWRSLDGGQTWEERSNGLPFRHLFTVTSTVDDGQVVLYCGSEPATLCRSADYGETWTELPALRDVPGRERWTFPAPPHEGHLKFIGIDPTDHRRIIACIEQGGLYLSEDGGQRWTQVTSWETDCDPLVYRDCHRVLFLRSNPDAMYLVGGDGLHFTPDRMRTWQHFDTTSVRLEYPDHVVIHPDDEQRIWIGGTISNPNVWRRTKDADSRVVYSQDGGRSWEVLANGWPAHMRAAIEGTSLHVSPESISLFIGNTDGEVWSSDDGGRSWTLIASGLPPVSKVGHYRNLMPATA